MRSIARGALSVLLILTLLDLPSVPSTLLAQEHVVPTADLRKAVAAAAQARQDNQAKIQQFFGSDQAKKALHAANIPYEKVQKAVATLSDEELTRLAARTEKAQNDFAAGSLSNQQITYIIIALATAVLILILVAAR